MNDLWYTEEILEYVNLKKNQASLIIFMFFKICTYKLMKYVYFENS